MFPWSQPMRVCWSACFPCASSTMVCLIRSQHRGRGIQKPVDWEGHSPEDMSWVPSHHVLDSQLFRDFYQRHPDQPTTNSARGTSRPIRQGSSPWSLNKEWSQLERSILNLQAWYPWSPRSSSLLFFPLRFSFFFSPLLSHPWLVWDIRGRPLRKGFIPISLPPASPPSAPLHRHPHLLHPQHRPAAGNFLLHGSMATSLHRYMSPGLWPASRQTALCDMRDTPG